MDSLKREVFSSGLELAWHCPRAPGGQSSILSDSNSFLPVKVARFSPNSASSRTYRKPGKGAASSPKGEAVSGQFRAPRWGRVLGAPARSVISGSMPRAGTERCRHDHGGLQSETRYRGERSTLRQALRGSPYRGEDGL